MASSAAVTPSAPSSQPPLGTESTWLPTMTVLSDAPGSVAKRFPAASVVTARLSGASFPLSHSRAVRQTGPQATRCAPSGVEVSAASSLRSAMTRCAFACEGLSMTDCGELTREAPGEMRRLAPRGKRVKESGTGDGAAIGAELEAADAFIEGRATAVREAVHEFFEAA